MVMKYLGYFINEFELGTRYSNQLTGYSSSLNYNELPGDSLDRITQEALTSTDLHK